MKLKMTEFDETYSEEFAEGTEVCNFSFLSHFQFTYVGVMKEIFLQIILQSYRFVIKDISVFFDIPIVTQAEMQKKLPGYCFLKAVTNNCLSV